MRFSAEPLEDNGKRGYTIWKRFKMQRFRNWTCMTGKYLGKMTKMSKDYKSEIERTKQHWAAISPDRSLWNYPHTGVIANKRFGDPSRDWIEQVASAYFRGREKGRALSIGCGIGSMDRAFIKRGMFGQALGLDASDGAIATAQKEADADGLALTYRTADLNQGLPKDASGPFDLIYGVASFHHIDALERLLGDCAARLAPDGLFMFYEYCGPSRFQWKTKTLEIANAILDLLPPELRGQKNCISRPPHSEFLQFDPSESVRSAEIIDLTTMFFEPIVIKNIGFTLTHPLLNPILCHFDDTNPYHTAIARLIFLLEELLIDSGALDADTKFVLARKRC
jgi:2-polyprenyl-3-methyl-5-hydroxy-6-metoxy-1,4-benzoquinol methylase